MKRLSSLSIFFPCCNEEENIRPLVRQALRVIPDCANKFEVIIVNDGSSDKTGKIADSLAEKHKEVKVVHHQKNLGYGAALQSGFKAAKYRWIFFTDGDLQFKIKELKTFIPYSKKYKAIIGFRKKRAEGFLRAGNAYLFKLFIDALFRVGVRDIDCAFKLLHAKTIKSLPLSSTGAFTSAEMLYRLKKKNIVFKQLPVNHFPRKRGSSTGNNIEVILKAGYEAVSLYLKIKLRSVVVNGS